MMANKVLTDTLSEPLNGATTATLDIDSGTGNLTIDGLTGGEQLLATGTLQYVEDQARPGTFVEAGVVKPTHGHWYIRTHADGRWTDNLLALPLRRRAA